VKAIQRPSGDHARSLTRAGGEPPSRMTCSIRVTTSTSTMELRGGRLGLRLSVRAMARRRPSGDQVGLRSGSRFHVRRRRLDPSGSIVQISPKPRTFTVRTIRLDRELALWLAAAIEPVAASTARSRRQAIACRSHSRLQA